MEFITILTTVFYAIALPVVVQAKRIYDVLLYNLIWLQKKLVSFAMKWLWPWVAEFLKIINFESIRTLHREIKEGTEPRVCASNYLDRAGFVEHIFIVFVSAMVLLAVAQLIDKYLRARIRHQVKKGYMYFTGKQIIVKEYPKTFEAFVIFVLVVVVYTAYMAIAYTLFFFHHTRHAFKHVLQ
jgi:hypothetical protein